MIEVGKDNNLKVIRKTNLGYMLSDGKEEILMHYKQASRELEIDEEVTVYVYTDKENRRTGTMQDAVLKVGKPGFVKVVQVIPTIGVFVSNNTPKDILISKDYLPFEEKLWPQVDDVIFAEVKLKKDVLMAKPVNRFDVIALKTKVKYQELEVKTAYVSRVNEKGLGLVTKDQIYVFVPRHQYRQEYHLGQEVNVTITKMLDGEAYGTLNEHKEILMDSDKELILNYLKAHKGVMPLTAKSSSEDVEKLFKISRKAFKRAYGALYKEQLIDFDEKNTYLLNK